MYKSLVALCLFLSCIANANQNAEQAAALYAQRDFNPAGIANAQQAIALYDLAINEEADATMKRTYQTQKASAHYFLGTALTEKEAKKAEHVLAMQTSEAVMVSLGMDPTTVHEMTQAQVNTLVNNLDDANEALAAEAMYTKGISLGQWGNLEGISSAIGRLPEVLGTMERIEMMGKESIHNYGPYRTVGRVNFVLPALFGGDLEVSEDYLMRATLATLVPGQQYSASGYNNLYLAETLHKRGKENQAKNILAAFINADFSTLNPGTEPENRQALLRAQELLVDWQ